MFSFIQKGLNFLESNGLAVMLIQMGMDYHLGQWIWFCFNLKATHFNDVG